MNSTISKSNIESCLHENWLIGMTPPSGYEVDEVFLEMPDQIPITVTYKPKEVAQLN